MGCPLNGITPACSILRADSDQTTTKGTRRPTNPRRPPGRRELESAEKEGAITQCRRKSSFRRQPTVHPARRFPPRSLGCAQSLPIVINIPNG